MYIYIYIYLDRWIVEEIYITIYKLLKLDLNFYYYYYYIQQQQQQILWLTSFF